MEAEFTKDELLSWKAVGEVAVFTFTRGRIRDERDILKKLESLGSYIKYKAGRKIILDLKNLEYLSSAGVGMLVGLLKKSKAGDGVLKLCSLQEPIRELFDILRLTNIFEIHPGIEKALESFKQEERAATRA